MVDFSSLLPAGLPATPTLLPTLLDLLPMGVMYYTPLVDATGTLTDLALAYLNPAAQRMTQLPAQPGTTYRQQFPTTDENGAWEFHRRSWLSQEPQHFQFYYDVDGFDSYFRVTAQHLGEGLLTIFTDTRDEQRSEVEKALHASQVREQAARAEAEAERQRLYQVLMRMPANIALLRGPEHVYDLVNVEYEQLFPARTTLGRTIREAIPDIEGQGFYELFDRVYETGEPFYEAEAEAWADFAGTGELQRRYYRTSFEPIRNAEGQVTEVLNFAVDVTQQVEARQQVEHLKQQAEAARTEAEIQRQRFYDLLMQLPAHVAVHEGPDQVFTLVNPGYQRQTPGRNLLGQPIRQVWPELVDHGILDVLDRVYQTGEPFIATELPVQADFTRTGQLEQVYYNFFFLPLRDAQGQINGVLNFSYDVTPSVVARQQVEQLNVELETRVAERTQEAQAARLLAEARKQRLEQLFRQAPAAICILEGPELVFELVNTLYQELFPGRPLLGLPMLAALPELVDQPVWHRLQQVYYTGLAHQDLGLHVPMARTAGGHLEDFYFNYIFQPRYNAEGQVDGVVVFCFEVTEQVVARQQVQTLNEELTTTNQELNQSNAQLTRTNVDLDTFVYTASHDLKAPITNIESIVLALRDTLPPDVQQDDVVAHLLELLDTTVARFRLTIDQLTDISKLQLAHAGPAEPVLLAQVVENVRLDLAPAITTAETQLTVEVAPELVVSFSPSNLRSIVYNLLGNAIKYRAAERPSQVRVHAEQTAARIVLTVYDNGLGMSEVQQRQLFGLFQRLHTHVEGTGVGLYITKRLIENAGGIIAVQSQPNVGTTFTVTFPA